MTSFKTMYTLERRKQESARIKAKYTERFPIIVEKSKTKTEIPDIDRHKFLVPKDFTVAEFIHVIRKRIKLLPEQAIFLFIGGQIPPISDTMSSLFQRFVEEDGFACESKSLSL